MTNQRLRQNELFEIKVVKGASQDIIKTYLEWDICILPGERNVRGQKVTRRAVL
jgi:hypothetical protein